MIFGNLFSILFFCLFVCMSKVILSFCFYFCLGFPAGRRTGSIALDRDEAKSTSSAGVLESLLNLFWWPFLPLFHCEKKVSVCTWYKNTFLGGFFSCWQYMLRTAGNPSANRKKKSHFQTLQRSAFPERTPLFTSNTF